MLASGATIGYRQVATAALPAPPVLPTVLGVVLVPDHQSAPWLPPANLVAAPVYMSPQGTPLSFFD